MAEQETRPPRAGLSGIPLAVAVLAVCIWIAFVVVMLLSAGSPDLQWTRLTFIFSSVEAVAFAAAGALFGVSVQRDRVEQAEQRAKANSKDAANGRALAAMTMADYDATPGPGGGSAYSEESYGIDGRGDQDLRRRHAEAARRLFPDL